MLTFLLPPPLAWEALSSYEQAAWAAAANAVEMVDPEGTILREIADPKMTRDDVALTYAFAIRQTGPGMSTDEFDYGKVNRAIMDRWSLAALKYVKEKAWRLVEGKTS